MDDLTPTIITPTNDDVADDEDNEDSSWSNTSASSSESEFDRTGRLTRHGASPGKRKRRRRTKRRRRHKKQRRRTNNIEHVNPQIQKKLETDRARFKHYDDGTKRCLCCSFSSRDHLRYVPASAKHFQKTTKGIRCCECKSLLCEDCIMDLHPQIQRIRKKLHSDCDDFVNGIELYVKSKGKKKPAKYIGHCCMISKRRAEEKQRERDEEEQRARDEEDRRVRDEEQGVREEGEMVERSGIGGGMVYYGHRLIVAATNKCMDVHCLGKEPGIKATPHSVQREAYAKLVDELGIKTLDEMPAEWRRLSFETELTLRPPHVIDTDKGKTSRQKVRDDLLAYSLIPSLLTHSCLVQFKTKIVFVPRVDEVDMDAIKGTNDLPYEQLKKHYLFKDEDEVDRDCTLFLGYEPGQPLEYAYILLLRFHKMKPAVPHKTSKQLLLDLEQHLKNNKLERRRSGGSSGRLCYSKELKQMMATSGSTPKRSKACCFLRGIDEKWHLIFLHVWSGGLDRYISYLLPTTISLFFHYCDHFDTSVYIYLHTVSIIKAL